MSAYFAEDTVSSNADPIAWWKLNCGRFPRLSQVAQMYLMIPASQASSERLLSTAKNFVDGRECLTTEHVEQLVFVKTNHQKLKKV